MLPFGQSGIRGVITFTDDASTLTIAGAARGMDQTYEYISLIYDIGSTPGRPGFMGSVIETVLGATVQARPSLADYPTRGRGGSHRRLDVTELSQHRKLVVVDAHPDDLPLFIETHELTEADVHLSACAGQRP